MTDQKTDRNIFFVLEKLQARLAEISQSLLDGQKEIENMHDYYWQNYTEMDQYGYEDYDNQQALLHQVNANQEQLLLRSRFRKMLDSPFFGRVDFCYDGDDEPEIFYIGIGNFAERPGELPLIYDWRSPVSGLFYDFDRGPASYLAPGGEMTGEICSKWQYKIRDGKMIYGFESDVKIDDDILKAELGSNGEVQLKNIIRTIQKEQNAIIRNTKDRILVIQGAAGSGKTSVALHRIAYLLYHDRQNLKSSNILILSPNGVFSDYISHILPELGEENIQEMSFDLFAYRKLQDTAADCEDRCDQIEREMRDPKAAERFALKQSQAFVDQMEGFALDLEDELMNFSDVSYKSFVKSESEIITLFYDKFADIPLLSRMDAVAETFIDEIETLLNRDLPEEERIPLIEKFRKMYETMDFYVLYNRFLKKEGYQTLPRRPLEKRKLRYEDVYPVLYLKYRLSRQAERSNIKHLVIDEMQDYSRLQYLIIRRMFSCKMTILGDRAQTMADQQQDVLQFLPGIFGKDLRRIEMRKSYRNTVEISDFANEILRHGDFAIYPVEPVLRHGTAVRKEAFDDEEALLAAGVQTIKTWQAQGYETIAVVCRDEAEAADTARKLKQYVPVVEEDLETAEFGEGVMVLPVAYTKGLEFDAVLLLDPTEEKYPENDGQVKLLYVAATRALHELAVLYTGELTGILAKEAPKGRHNQEFAMETLTKAKEYEKVSLTQKEAREENRAIGIQEMDERNSHGPKRIVIKPEQRPGMALGNTSTTGTAVMAKGSTVTRRAAAETGEEIAAKTMQQRAPEGVSSIFAGAAYHGKAGGKAPGSRRSAGTQAGMQYGAGTAGVQSAKRPGGAGMVPGEAEKTERLNTSPYAFGAIPENELLRIKGHSKIKCAVKWAKKGKSAVEIASMYGILRITPITPEVIRISFVKGVTAKVQDTYWKPKADTAFPWSAKESKTAVLVETEKLRVMVEKKDGAVQFLTPDNKPILSEKRDEPRMIDGGMTWTFFDWSGSEKLKAKGILSTEWLDLTAKARYVSFGGKQARMPLLVSNRGYGIAAAASRTALLCNVRTFGTYLHTAGDGQIDYYFILGKDREEIVKQYKEL